MEPLGNKEFKVAFICFKTLSATIFNNCLASHKVATVQFLLKSLSPIFFYFDEKLSHSWKQIKKKQYKCLRLSMGFDRKKIKI